MASRRFNLSAIQVSAGILAALTGAVAASFLGVGGTLVGAAVGSIASTVGGEVYKHYLERTHERLRGAVDGSRFRTAPSTVAGTVIPTVAQNRLGVTSRRQEDGAAAAETQILKVPRPDAPGHGAVTTPRTTSPNDPMRDSPTETFAAVDGLPQAMPAGTAAAMASAAAAKDGQGKRPRWLVLTAITVGMFLVAVAVITVIELSVGKPFFDILSGRHGSGTTVSHVVSGQTQPTPRRTASPSPTTSSSPTPSVSASPTPSSSSLGATSSPSATITPGAPNVPAPTPTPSS